MEVVILFAMIIGFLLIGVPIAVSLGMSYQDERLTAAARLEYRADDGTLSGSDRESETILLVSDLSYRIDDDRRLIASLDASTTDGDGTIVESGDLISAETVVVARVGPALVPIGLAVNAGEAVLAIAVIRSETVTQ